MRLKVAAICDQGTVRSRNEDNLFFDGKALPEIHKSTTFFSKSFSLSRNSLFGVFDGMGGYSAGETASFLAARTAQKLWRSQDDKLTPEQTLRDICTEANRIICDEMLKRGGIQMGTTAAFLLFSRSQFYLCNIGDSPIFRLKNGSFQELSLEHTERIIFERVTKNKSNPRKKFQLTQNLGISPDEFMIDPFYRNDSIYPGDVFLICSDGITDMISAADIKNILLHFDDPQDSAQALLKQALESGGKDNITAIVIKVYRKLDFLKQLRKKH